MSREEGSFYEDNLRKVLEVVNRLENKMEEIRKSVNRVENRVTLLELKFEYFPSLQRIQHGAFSELRYSPVEYPESQWNSITKPDYK